MNRQSKKFIWGVEDIQFDYFTAPSEDAVKAKDMDGDGFVFDNTPKQRPATAEEKKAGSPKSKGQKLLEKKMQANALKKPKSKKGGGKKKLTEEEKAAEKEKKHQEKVKAQVAQIDDYTDKLQAELERLTALGDSFKDESNLRKRLGQAIKRLKTKKERLLNSKANVDAGAEDLLSEAGTKALPKPFEDSTWVGFYLNTHDAQAIEDEQLEGEIEERPHLTLAMLRTLSYEERAQVAGLLSGIAESSQPISVQTDGVGVFDLPDSDCVHVKVTGNSLTIFRTAVEQALKPYLDEQHAYNPHITLAYCPKGTDTSAIAVPDLTLSLPMLTFAEGTRNWNFALGYGFAGVQDWAEAVEEDEPVKSVPFFDFVGMQAMFEGESVGTIEAIKRFGEYEGIKATKENPVVVIDGKPYASDSIEIIINE